MSFGLLGFFQPNAPIDAFGQFARNPQAELLGATPAIRHRDPSSQARRADGTLVPGWFAAVARSNSRPARARECRSSRPPVPKYRRYHRLSVSRLSLWCYRGTATDRVGRVQQTVREL